ncbi:DNA polymerase B family protein, partial [Vibrio parahaemolyticus V-223/04]
STQWVWSKVYYWTLVRMTIKPCLVFVVVSFIVRNTFCQR